ncbi:MAG: hypothetical protein AB7P76_02735 [Candidatus Melainabacteria bacterium]
MSVSLPPVSPSLLTAPRFGRSVPSEDDHRAPATPNAGKPVAASLPQPTPDVPVIAPVTPLLPEPQPVATAVKQDLPRPATTAGMPAMVVIPGPNGPQRLLLDPQKLAERNKTSNKVRHWWNKLFSLKGMTILLVPASASVFGTEVNHFVAGRPGVMDRRAKNQVAQELLLAQYRNDAGFSENLARIDNPGNAREFVKKHHGGEHGRLYRILTQQPKTDPDASTAMGRVRGHVVSVPNWVSERTGNIRFRRTNGDTNKVDDAN